MRQNRQRGAQTPSTQDRIVDTATALFMELGYAGTSMSALAKACGMQKASLYHHFESKEAVLFACFQNGYAENVEHMRAVAEQHDRPYADRLDDMIDGVYRGVVHSTAGRMSPVIAETTGRIPEIARRFNDEFIEEMHEIFMRFVEGGMAAGAFKRFDLEALDHLIFGIPVNLTLCRAMFASFPDLEKRYDVDSVKKHHLLIIRTILDLRD